MSDDTTRPATGSEHLTKIREAFAWMDTLRGWDIPTHMEYERLRNRALPAAEALAEERDALAEQVERWKRMALAHDAYEDALNYGVGWEDQERAREELRAAQAALRQHGDLPEGGDQ